MMGCPACVRGLAVPPIQVNGLRGDPYADMTKGVVFAGAIIVGGLLFLAMRASREEDRR